MGQRVKCTTGKFKNLSSDKNYEVLSQEGDFYFVNNDAGLRQRYNRRNFVDSLLSLEELSGVVIDYDSEGGEFSLHLVHHDTPTEDQICLIAFDVEEVSGSCGIGGYSGINDAWRSIDSLYQGEYNGRANVDDILTKVKEGFTQLVTRIISEERMEDNGAAITFSTNDSIPAIWEVLDELADVTTASMQSNHTNTLIKLWVMYIRDL